MTSAVTIRADHKDLIHDVSYDFYGKRFATCSSDQMVKVWDQDEEGNWVCSSKWKAHSGSVWKVTWAHPEFGQVLATCSFDRSVVIWEEKVEVTGDKIQSTWIRRAGLVDSRQSVMDVQFSPKHLGLLLATCSTDGTLRIYEAPDIMNLSIWNPVHEINCKIPCSSISWNPSPFHAPMIAVGSDDQSTNGSKVQIFESSEKTSRWYKVDVISFITDPVFDVSFAPNVGRDDHLLAVASGHSVSIISIKPVSSAPMDLDQSVTSPIMSLPKYSIKQLAKFDDHLSKVWRVAWNVMGTILASSSEDGVIHLWKSNYLDSWKCVGTIKTDEKKKI